MAQVCRTCLEDVPDFNSIRIGNVLSEITEKLRTCVPELDVDMVPDAVMCIYCVNALQSSYDFKQKCLNTEKQIRMYLHTQVDLNELMTECVSVGDNNVPKLNGDVTLIELNEDDDDLNEGACILGVCESAPRKQPTSDAPSTSLASPNNVNSIGSPKLYSTARKSTTKGPYGVNTKRIPGRRTSLPNFTCASCKVLSNDIGEYVTHVKNIHKGSNPSYKCPKCPFNTKVPNMFMQHYENGCQETSTPTQNVDTLKCPHCDFETLEITTLNNHIDSHILQCNKCYYIATNRSEYQKHIRTHTLVMDTDEVVVIDDEDDLKCIDCNFTAKAISQYENHCLEEHNRKYPHVCKECGYTATSKSVLNGHDKFHTGNRLYRCGFCSYNCDLLDNFNRHVANRHQRK